MNCKEAVLAAAQRKAAKLSTRQRNKLQSAHDDGNPLLWQAVERFLRHRYERDTGIKIGAAFDWSTIVSWIATVMPLILKLLLLFI